MQKTIEKDNSKRFKPAELIKNLIELDDTLGGIATLISVRANSDSIKIVVEAHFSVDERKRIMSLKDRIVPFIVISNRSIVNQEVENVSFIKKEVKQDASN